MYALTQATDHKQDAEQARQHRSRVAQILNVPHTRKELTWQLGKGGWKLLRLRPSLAAALLNGLFEHPAAIEASAPTVVIQARHYRLIPEPTHRLADW